MDTITIKNFRCFGEEQTAKLAPITLLVGENSTGKTSLMAIIRALWDAAYEDIVPNFKDSPYDLGSFDEILHISGRRGPRPESFTARCNITSIETSDQQRDATYSIEVEFAAAHATPFPRRRRLSQGSHWIEQYSDDSGQTGVSIGTQRGTWKLAENDEHRLIRPRGIGDVLLPLPVAIAFFRHLISETDLPVHRDPSNLSERPEDEDLEEIEQLVDQYLADRQFPFMNDYSARPYASAPTRSQPKRTYDPSRVVLDAEGNNVPTRLALMSLYEPETWNKLRGRLEAFGTSSGLFDEIRIQHLGETASSPFQIQVRKTTKRRKGPLHNLADVGYGVSQVLPLITELLREDGPQVMLLQQPEVHLHPSAEAALGSLLCDVVTEAPRRRQLIIETHSDFIIDRIRTSVPDPSSNLSAEDVSIIFFERRGLQVTLHSLSVDEAGNIVGTPPGYRKFFLDELQRSIHLD